MSNTPMSNIHARHFWEPSVDVSLVYFITQNKKKQICSDTHFNIITLSFHFYCNISPDMLHNSWQEIDLIIILLLWEWVFFFPVQILLSNSFFCAAKQPNLPRLNCKTKSHHKIIRFYLTFWSKLSYFHIIILWQITLCHVCFLKCVYFGTF